jgi:hypothetical protein
MNDRLLGGALGLLLAALAAGAGHEAGPPKAAASPWLTDYARARAEAARTGLQRL